MSDYLDLTEADDGKLFRVRIDNTGEERIARYHWLWLAGRKLKPPCFADPDCVLVHLPMNERMEL